MQTLEVDEARRSSPKNKLKSACNWIGYLVDVRERARCYGVGGRVIMRTLEYPIEKARELIDLLNGENEFQVLEKLVHGDTFAAYVLCGHAGFTWGHFYRAVFCSVYPRGDDTIVVSISHLDIQKAWYGSNLFRIADRRIEDQVLEYVSQHIRGGRTSG